MKSKVKRTRARVLTAFFLIVFLGTFASVTGAAGQQGSNLFFILDASGSM